MRANKFLAWTLASTLVAGLAAAADNVLVSDAEREQTLRGQLQHLHIANLKVNVLGKMATLEGTAESLFQVRQASTIAKRSPEIEEVFNDLEVIGVEDETLERALGAQLGSDIHYTIYDEVQLSVARGRVVLTGRLAPEGDPGAIEETLSKVPGVGAIENRIRVLPFYSGDDKLREAVAIVVYDALGQKRLAHSRLHIVVENGRVTLSGTVPDEETRTVAEEAARQVEGTDSIENRLTLDERPGARASP